MPARRSDIFDLTAKYKAGERRFFLDMERWRNFRTRYRLDWQKTRFEAANLATVPEVRGIYAFTLELAPSKLPSHGYILYVGITGDKSAANLRKRCAQYLRHLRDKTGRPRVLNMLHTWQSDLFFNFVPLPNSSIDLAKIERAMLDAIVPPVNDRDMSAEITAARKAAF